MDCVLSDVGYHKNCYDNFCTLRRMPLKSISNVAEKITIAQTNLVDNFQLLGFKETIYKVWITWKQLICNASVIK